MVAFLTSQINALLAFITEPFLQLRLQKWLELKITIKFVNEMNRRNTRGVKAKTGL